MEFLERVEENITRNRENSRMVIRGMLDEYFNDSHDNWWTPTRHEVQNYAEFKTLFKAKYWSESTQNIVCNDLCNGKYDTSRGATLTAYFLGKVCLARNLETKIPEECLVTKLAFHYEEGVARARLGGQMKTIQSMAPLPENYEHENYYRRSRQRHERYAERNNQNYYYNNHNNYRGNYDN